MPGVPYYRLVKILDVNGVEQALSVEDGALCTRSYLQAIANREYARITTRANIDPTTKFRTDSMFYPFTDSLLQNTTLDIVLDAPTKLPEKTDIKVSVIATTSGAVVASLRGWLE